MARHTVRLVEASPSLEGSPYKRRDTNASSPPDEGNLEVALAEAARRGPTTTFTVGPYWVVLTLGVIDGRPEVIHVSIHGNDGTDEAAPVTAQALRQIPLGRLFRDALKVQGDALTDFRNLLEMHPRPPEWERQLAAFREELGAYEETRRQRGGAPRRDPERLLEIAEAFRRHEAAGHPSPRRATARDVNLSESGVTKALAAARSAGLLELPSKPARRKPVRRRGKK